MNRSDTRPLQDTRLQWDRSCKCADNWLYSGKQVAARRRGSTPSNVFSKIPTIQALFLLSNISVPFGRRTGKCDANNFQCRAPEPFSSSHLSSGEMLSGKAVAINVLQIESGTAREEVFRRFELLLNRALRRAMFDCGFQLSPYAINALFYRCCRGLLPCQ